MYDAIIVGARVAGAPTAMLLARKGYRVLLVDRATFPSDIMSTHYIHTRGVAQLKKWGLLDEVIASNCPPITKATSDLGPFALTGWGPEYEGVSPAYAPRRYILDTILVKAAIEAGVEVREGFTVESLIMDNGRVVGLRGHIRGGESVTELARIVIGADGKNSLVARAVQAPTYNEVPALTCAYYTYWSGVDVPGVELYPRDGRFIVAFPTNDNLVCIGVQWPHAEFHTFRADIENNYLKTLELAPDLAERVRGGKREERFVGTADLDNFFRKPYGAGWTLVGDAGYHRDPNTGCGISDSFCDAELLADALDAGFSGRQPLEIALAHYEQERNTRAMPMYGLTCQFASLLPLPPDMQQLFGALRGNEYQTERFFGVTSYTVSAAEFFSPENIGAIMGEAEPLAA